MFHAQKISVARVLPGLPDSTFHTSPFQSAQPIPSETALLIQERALGIRRPEAFGARQDREAIGFESLLPAPVKASKPDQQPKIRIGGPRCRQPYEASCLNASALSFGPLSKNFILALNKAAREGEFFQNTGEAGLSPYHFGIDVNMEAADFNIDRFFERLAQGGYPESELAGDIVWQLGTGYFGCRNVDGSFDETQFTQKASLPNVKMIELKLSQGVEPRPQMPVKQVTPGIAKMMGINWEKQAVLQDRHSAFSSPVALLNFVADLRTLSGGKPIGFKLGISHRQYFFALCKAMLKTGILPDFITVDGMEAGTAASIKGASGFTGTTLNDALVFVHNALVGTRLRPHIKIIASGQVFTEQDILCKLARGADLCATARGMMIATGCDQQRECHLGTCHRGIATQDPELTRHFNIETNAQRIYNYHRITLEELRDLLSIAGVDHPNRIGPFHVQKRTSLSTLQTLDELYTFIKPGTLLSFQPWRIPRQYRSAWWFAKPGEPFTKAFERQLQSNYR